MVREQTPRSPAATLPRPTLGARFSLIRFFGEVISELRKVNWPTRQEATRLTMLVLAVSAAMGIFLGVLDNLFSRLFGYIAR